MIRRFVDEIVGKGGRVVVLIHRGWKEIRECFDLIYVAGM